MYMNSSILFLDDNGLVIDVFYLGNDVSTP